MLVYSFYALLDSKLYAKGTWTMVFQLSDFYFRMINVADNPHEMVGTGQPTCMRVRSSFLPYDLATTAISVLQVRRGSMLR